MVVIDPFSMPNFSCSTFATGPRQLVVQLAFERGLLVLGAGDNTIRLCPPLVVTVDQCEFALDTLEECLRMATANG